MSRFVLFDTGPLGQIARKRPPEAMVTWAERLTSSGVRLAVPEICDYELRREYIRAGLKESLVVLDLLPTVYDYIPLDTTTMQRAAELWAFVRAKGKPTVDLRTDLRRAYQAAFLPVLEVGFAALALLRPVCSQQFH